MSSGSLALCLCAAAACAGGAVLLWDELQWTVYMLNYSVCPNGAGLVNLIKSCLSQISACRRSQAVSGLSPIYNISLLNKTCISSSSQRSGRIQNTWDNIWNTRGNCWIVWDIHHWKGLDHEKVTFLALVLKQLINRLSENEQTILRIFYIFWF